MDIQRIAGAIGARATGLDLRKPLVESAVAELRRAFVQHKVLVLPGQPLTPQQFLDFAKAFGRPIEYPFVAVVSRSAGLVGHIQEEITNPSAAFIWETVDEAIAFKAE